jgi:hypothetical protein
MSAGALVPPVSLRMFSNSPYVLNRTVGQRRSRNATPSMGTEGDARRCFVHRSPSMFIYFPPVLVGENECLALQ